MTSAVEIELVNHPGFHPKLIFTFNTPFIKALSIQELKSASEKYEEQVEKTGGSSSFYVEDHSEMVALVQFPELIKSVFVDSYQLSNMNTPRIKYFSSVNQDLEAPEFDSKAKETCLLVQAKVDLEREESVQFEIPLHLRYHAPSTNSSISYQNVELDIPTIYLYRDAPRYDQYVPEDSDSDVFPYNPCLSTYPPHHHTLDTSDMLIKLPHGLAMNSPQSIPLQIPIPYQGDQVWVFPLTLLFNMLAALLVIWTTYKAYYHNSSSPVEPIQARDDSMEDLKEGLKSSLSSTSSPRRRLSKKVTLSNETETREYQPSTPVTPRRRSAVLKASEPEEEPSPLRRSARHRK